MNDDNNKVIRVNNVSTLTFVSSKIIISVAKLELVCMGFIRSNLYSLNHININPFDICTIVIQLVNNVNNSLFDRIIQNGYFNEKLAARALKQMMEALSDMHDSKIVHRDIQHSNLFFATSEEDAPLKLVDFGFSQSIAHGLLTTPCGTPLYVAPEVLRNEPHGTPVDMWCTGTILYIMLCGNPPFYMKSEYSAFGRVIRYFRKIKRAHYDMPAYYWNDISRDAKDLVRRLLSADPSKRLTAKQVLNHRWILNASDKNVMSKQGLINLRRFQCVVSCKRGIRRLLIILRLIDGLLERLNQEKQNKLQNELKRKLSYELPSSEYDKIRVYVWNC